MTVDAIKEFIEQMPEQDRHALAFWLNELEYDAWDRQMVEDFSPNGRGAALIDTVKREIANAGARTVSSRQRGDGNSRR